MIAFLYQPALIQRRGIDLQLQLTDIDTNQDHNHPCRLCRFTHRIILIAMQTGTIARLTDKGFGFISREGQEKDLFFHSNELVGVSFDELREGDKLQFEVADSPKGPNAVKVSRVS